MVERKGCLEVGVAVFTLIVALLGGSAVIGIYFEMWTQNHQWAAPFSHASRPRGLRYTRDELRSWSVSTVSDAFRGGFGSPPTVFSFCRSLWLLLLYGGDLWWTGRAPDVVGGILSSTLTGFLIGVAAGATVTKRLSKDTIGRG
ncbi:hypothetical protein PXH69_33935 [Rhodococcus qingshengii]|uniref:Uncharacterized protein n=1 Tax=Rhodococcus qingshengii TaxID=334542 RepID=A0AAW6LQR2_RHOSG|nr:hypothetical protein [Rhodococcus qingshengii]MDE8649967.1 hypothetical protein [Rhodococcus qingshengii]